MEGDEAGVTTGQTRMDGNGGPAQVPDGPADKAVIVINNNNRPIMQKDGAQPRWGSTVRRYLPR